MKEPCNPLHAAKGNVKRERCTIRPTVQACSCIYQSGLAGEGAARFSMPTPGNRDYCEAEHVCRVSMRMCFHINSGAVVLSRSVVGPAGTC